MTELGRAARHAARGIEELLRAGAELLAALERGGPDGDLVASLRTALVQEVERWEARAATDPAARRVRDLFALLVDLMETSPGGPAESTSECRSSQGRKRRSAHRREASR